VYRTDARRRGRLVIETAESERVPQAEVLGVLSAPVTDEGLSKRDFDEVERRLRGRDQRRMKACRREIGLMSPTPVREAVHLYAERHTANDLERIMGRSQKKDTTLDHLPATTKASVALER
jgi:hypothetical protein